MSETTKWLEFFDRAFNKARAHILEQNPLEDDGSGSPETLAWRELAEGFPCSISLVEIRFDEGAYPNIKDETCQMIKYDFTSMGQRKVDYYGIINSKDKEKLKLVLTSSFKFDDESFESFYKDFNTIGWSDDTFDFYVQFTCYDLKGNMERFVMDFLIFAQSILEQRIVRRIEQAPDFNSIFGLRPDRILSIQEIASIDPTTQIFRKSMEHFQEQICDVQLIPSVPEHPKRVFESAKKLYIFGYFYYRFFTISEHYSYLALESAIRHRYNQSLGAKAIITNSKGESVELPPSWLHIFYFCEGNKKKWGWSRVKVNGEKFPHNNRFLLDCLVDKKIITKWERRQYDVGIQLRNSLSHQEFAPIRTPNSSSLRMVAERINRLFYNKRARNPTAR